MKTNRRVMRREMVKGETYEMPRLALTYLWGACKMESLGMAHSSASKYLGYRGTAEAKHLFGWPQNLSKKETFRRVDCLRKPVIEGDYDGMTWVYPIPLVSKEQYKANLEVAKLEANK